MKMTRINPDTKKKETVELSNEIHVKAYKAKGWETVEPKEKAAPKGDAEE